MNLLAIRNIISSPRPAYSGDGTQPQFEHTKGVTFKRGAGKKTSRARYRIRKGKAR